MEDIKLPEPQVKHFVAWCLHNGGEVAPIKFDKYNSMYPSYCNPSIFYDERADIFRLIQRNVSYTLHHTHKDFWTPWGPLQYAIPQERFNWLETRNFYGECKDPMNDDWNFHEIKMNERKQMWEFRGLEDVRIVNWEGNIFGIGVRRDDNPNGVGRMNAMLIDQETKDESYSVKIKAPGEDKAYCIKNQSIITDMPYHLIDTFNPLHIIKFDVTGNVETIVKKDKVEGLSDEGYDMMRGSTQTIPWKDGHLTIVHTCTMWYTANKRKYARYVHAFVEYDKDWNIRRMSPLFSFNDDMVEFCTGMTMKDNDLYISFALQDNCSYILKVSANMIDQFITWAGDTDDTTIWGNYPDQRELFNYAMEYFNKGDYSAAYTWFLHAVDIFPYTYNEQFMMARCIANLGHRDVYESGMWYLCYKHDPNRPEACAAIAEYYRYRGQYPQAAHWATEAYNKVKAHPCQVFFNDKAIEQIYRNALWETSDYDKVSKAKGYKAF